MNSFVSAYMNGLRLIAAAVVLASHFAFVQFTGGALPSLGRYGHNAVISFFVLSGFAIAYAAAERTPDWRHFVASRAARIYSVALPALAVTAGIDLFLRAHGNPFAFNFYQYENLWKYLPLFVLFGTDWWFLTESTFSNLPFWSLCYEVWYYVAFTAFYYLSGWRRVIVIVVVAAMVGPRLWILFPVWLFGVAAYSATRHATISVSMARVMFFVSLALILAIGVSGVDILVDDRVNTLLQGWPKARLRYSKWTAGDLILGVLLAIHLLAAHGSKFRIGRMAHPIAVVATATFSIYLMHFPLLEFWAGYEQLSPGLLLAAVLVSIMPIWLLTEVARRRLQVLLLQVLDGAVGFRRALQGTGAPRRQASSAGPALSLHEAKARLIDVAVGD